MSAPAIEVRRLRRAGTRVVVLQPGPTDLTAMGMNMMDGSRAGGVLDAAVASTRARLAAQPELVELMSER